MQPREPPAGTYKPKTHSYTHRVYHCFQHNVNVAKFPLKTRLWKSKLIQHSTVALTDRGTPIYHASRACSTPERPAVLSCNPAHCIRLSPYVDHAQKKLELHHHLTQSAKTSSFSLPPLSLAAPSFGPLKAFSSLHYANKANHPSGWCSCGPGRTCQCGEINGLHQSTGATHKPAQHAQP